MLDCGQVGWLYCKLWNLSTGRFVFVLHLRRGANCLVIFVQFFVTCLMK